MGLKIDSISVTYQSTARVHYSCISRSRTAVAASQIFAGRRHFSLRLPRFCLQVSKKVLLGPVVVLSLLGEFPVETGVDPAKTYFSTGLRFRYRRPDRRYSGPTSCMARHVSK